MSTSRLIVHYAAAGLLLVGLGLGAYFHWWNPGVLEALLVSSLAGLGVTQGIIYGAKSLTPTNPTNPGSPREDL